MWRVPIFLLALSPAMADERTALYGLWGDERQCAAQPIVPGASLLAQPFEIRPGWMRHGIIWCRLDWLLVEPRGDGLFASTRAQCGEDAVRDYRLDFALSEETLTMIWDERVVTGPLPRCPEQS